MCFWRLLLIIVFSCLYQYAKGLLKETVESLYNIYGYKLNQGLNALGLVLKSFMWLIFIVLLSQ